MAWGTILQIIGTGASIFSSLQAADDASDAYELQSQWYEREAEIRKEKAAYEVERLRRRTKQLISENISGAIAQGGTGGSVGDVIADITNQAALDVEIIKRGGQAMVAQSLTSADISRARGESTKRAGYLDAASTLLTNLGEIDWSNLFKTSDTGERTINGN